MKKILVTASFFIAASIGLLGVSSLAHAETDIVTDSQLQKIRDQCTELQATLGQLQDSDKVIRLDRGRLYGSTVTEKLMVPFNQRLASNRLDGSKLVSITAEFTTTYQTFVSAYRNYDASLTKLLAIDCRQQPSQFYSQLKTVRTNRKAVRTSIESLNKLASEYRTHIDDFRTKNEDKK